MKSIQLKRLLGMQWFNFFSRDLACTISSCPFGGKYEMLNKLSLVSIFLCRRKRISLTECTYNCCLVGTRRCTPASVADLGISLGFRFFALKWVNCRAAWISVLTEAISTLCRRIMFNRNWSCTSSGYCTRILQFSTLQSSLGMVNDPRVKNCRLEMGDCLHDGPT